MEMSELAPQPFTLHIRASSSGSTHCSEKADKVLGASTSPTRERFTVRASLLLIDPIIPTHLSLL
ncbi:hypothetical protein CH063_15438, partial [Colletotrichum higginsianum]